MKPYPKYKSSGIEWIGAIPEHWNVAPLKYSISKFYSGGTPDTSNETFWSEGMEAIPWVSIADITSSQGILNSTARSITEAGRTSKQLELVPKGTLLLSIFASLGKTTRLAIEATMNQAILGLQTKPGFSTAFLEYFLKDCSRYISVFSSSNTQENLNLNKIKNLVMVLPPEAEQTAAAAFLDDKTAQIDTLIEKKRKLIELLKEERQAVINEAVTKGMNPKARMKPSGVEWLGDVPEGWEVIPFKRLCERIVVGIAEAATHAYRETGTPILRSTNVKDGKLSGSILHIDEEFAGGRDSKSIRAYDIVTVRTGNAGESAVVPLEFDGCQCFTMLISTLRQPNLAAFYNYLLNSETGKTYFELTAWGTAQKNISVPILQEFIVSHPSGAEQEEIVQYLDQKAQQSNELIERAQKEMELLQEYRTALITEVVTGKVCVV